MTFKNILLFVVLVVLLQGCASSKRIAKSLIEEEPDYESLYIRGSFSWWEADEQYKVNYVGDNKYSVLVDLVADGQPYDFKFSDAIWSPELTCGYSVADYEIVTEGVLATASCGKAASVDNFKFTPEVSGLYLFSITFSTWAPPKVLVTKAD